MFAQQTFQEMSLTQSSDNDLFLRRALQLFDRSLLASRARKLTGLISRRPAHLLDLDDLQARVSNRHYTGLQTVRLNQIRGSLGRPDSFDADFNPTQEHTKQRWVNIAAAMQAGEALPPVELIQVGDVYYVSDGHHRISAARALKQAFIEAVVTTWEVAA